MTGRMIIFTLCVFFFTVMNSALYAAAPELQRVMPNSWRRLNRMPPEEEKSFLERNTPLLEQIGDIWRKKINSTSYSDWLLRLNSIYVEQAGEDTFLRLVYAKDETLDFYDKSVFFLQALAFNISGEAKLLMMSAYNGFVAHERYGNRKQITSIDLVRGKNGAKGVMLTSFQILEETSSRRKVKGQVAGIENRADYYSLSDLKEKELDVAKIDSWVWSPSITRIPYIFIQASDCLVDENIPLRYSLQNAFDGDPSTSYVENTRDDLMKIEIDHDYKKTEKVAIINGYAQSAGLYTQNNRIREVLVSGYQLNAERKVLEETVPAKWICKDNTLNVQMFQVPNALSNISISTIKISGIFRGTVYNDTCLAELNIKTEEGWLFGEIDE